MSSTADTTPPQRFFFTDRPVLSIAVPLALVLMVGIWPGKAEAQFFDQKPMAIGDLGNVYVATGAQPESWKSEGIGMEWPGIYQRGFLRADALWIGVKNFTNADGESFDRKVVHAGPRLPGAGEFFPQEFETVARFETPKVTVNGRRTLDNDPSVDRVDPDLPAERMLRMRVNTLTGIELEKRIYAWSQDYHDSYHIQEYILTNTGNTDNDEEVELPEQTAEDVYLHMQRRYVFQDKSSIPGSEWGANMLSDVVGDGMEDYEVDFHASYSWLGNSQGADLDPLGGPAWNDSPFFIPDGDDGGQLTVATHAGVATLHADTSPTDGSHDPDQPAMTGFINSDDPITTGNDAFKESQMRKEYQYMADAGGTGLPVPEGGNSGPHEYPHHADVADEDGNLKTADGDPMLGTAGGWSLAWSYGPYTLEPGESVRVVVAEGVGGLGRTASVLIGRKWKESAGGNRSQADPTTPLPYDADHNGTIEPDERLSKNEWVLATKDSLFQTFQRAIANFEAGALEEGSGANTIPLPPKPPKTFDVIAGVNKIDLEWTTYDGGGAEEFWVYRGKNRLMGSFERERPYTYEKIATIEADGSEEYSYVDENAIRGIDYFYYVQAVGSENTDGTAMTPTGQPLKSSRYYTQTYDPASLKRPSGESTSAFKIVPNPFNISSDQSVRWPGRDNRIGFLEVPGNCTIRIYTEVGELVTTIRHDDGSGDEFWDLTTRSGQLVASGVYIAVVENVDNGEVSRKKFVIVR